MFSRVPIWQFQGLCLLCPQAARREPGELELHCHNMKSYRVLSAEEVSHRGIFVFEHGRSLPPSALSQVPEPWAPLTTHHTMPTLDLSQSVCRRTGHEGGALFTGHDAECETRWEGSPSPTWNPLLQVSPLLLRVTVAISRSISPACDASGTRHS